MSHAAISPCDATIVVPTFNEGENISKLVEAVFGLYPKIHMLVVDDRSPDGTAGIVRGLQDRFPNLMLLERMKNPGFGCSYRDGFRHALSRSSCRAVVMMDADFSHDPAVVGRLLAKLADHDVVVGSRYTRGGSVKNWNLRRRMLSRGANFYVHTVLGLPMRDTTAGFMALRREALEAIPYGGTMSDGYAFLVELKYLLGQGTLRIAEFPITFDERREGQSKMSAGKMWESVLLPWRIKYRGGVRVLALQIFLFAFAGTVACPIRYWPVATTLDNSWQYNVNYAAAHGLVPGRDFFSVTGPLGYLTFPMDVGRNLEYGLWFQSALGIVLLGVLADLYFRAGLPLRNLVLFTALFAMSYPLFWFNHVGLDNLMLAAALVCVVLYRWRGGWLRLATALVLIGILAQIKFTSGFLAAGAMAGFVIERFFACGWKAWREAMLVVVVPLLLFGVGLLATVPMEWWGAFLKSTAEVSGGYSVALSWPGPLLEFVAALEMLLLVGLALAVNGRSGRTPAAFLALLLAVPLAVSLKHGFVRQDVHTVNLFCFCALAMALIMLSARLEGRRAWGAAAVLLPFLALWQDYAGPKLPAMRSVQFAWGALDLPRIRKELLRQTQQNSQEPLRMEPELRAAIGDSPVGFLSISFGLAVALDHVRLAVIPPIFADGAYTPYLDGVFAEWVRAKGPRFLVFDGTTIDKRNSWAAVPAAWTEIYRWYDTRLMGKYNLLLERRAAPRFLRMVSVGSYTVNLKDGFTLPEDAMFWTMKCALSTTGKRNRLLWRVPPLMMDAESRAGGHTRFRILPEQMVNPVMGSLPAGIAEFARIFDHGGRPPAPVSQVAFGKSAFWKYDSGDQALASYQPACEVEFLRPEL